MVDLAIADDVGNETTAVPLLMVLIVWLLLGRVSVPFPECIALMCVWFIGVTLPGGAVSRQIGCGDSCIPDDGAVEDVVVFPADAVIVVVVVF